MFAVTQYTGFSARAASASAPPNTPGLSAWYDFSDAANLTVSGNYITTAVDKSTGGHNAIGTVTGTNTFHPVVATAAQNGLNAADFSTAVATSQGPVLTAGTGAVPGTGAPFSFTAVAKNTGTGSTAHPNLFSAYWDAGGSVVNQLQGTANGTTVDQVLGHNVNSDATISGIAQPDTWHIYSGTLADRSQLLKLDGGVSTATGTLTYTDSHAVGRLFIGNVTAPNGATHPWTGLIGEIRFFSTNIGTSDIQKEEGYLAWKWGLASQLPANHPYKNAPP